MKFTLRSLALILSLTLCFILSACSPKGSAKDFYYFNSQIHVQTEGSLISDDAINEIDQLLNSLHQTFDADVQDSFTKRYNSAKVGDHVAISKTISQVIDRSLSSFTFTDGKFNPAIFPLLDLWQFTGNSTLPFTPPSPDQINATLSSANLSFDKIKEGATADYLIKADGMQLDFGGILKGFAAEKIADILKAEGHTKGYVSVGTSSMYLLSVTSLGIKHPRKDGTIIDFKLNGKTDLSVSTSGDYERYHQYDERKYSHLIDPASGYPADTGIASATIIGTDAALADAVSTAICLCKHSTATNDSELTRFITKIILEYPSASIFIVYDNGTEKQILTNKKQGEDFTLLDQNYSIFNL